MPEGTDKKLTPLAEATRHLVDQKREAMLRPIGKRVAVLTLAGAELFEVVNRDS